MRKQKADEYTHFLENISKAGDLSDKDKIDKYLKVFNTKGQEIRKEIDQFNKQISAFPLAVLIRLWADNLGKNEVLGEKYLSMMWDLIENRVIPLKDQKSGKPLTLDTFKLSNSFIIDQIRCNKKWTIDERELLVVFYQEFSRWLSHQTFNLISEAIDYEKELASHRKISFSTYIEFIKALEPRERILTKIFYLGGSVALEDVLSIKIENLNFEDSCIKIGCEDIEFPSHLMCDLKEFVGDKKKGYVFRGKQNDRINHTVPYRALKPVAIKLGFAEDFTFKEFVKNQ